MHTHLCSKCDTTCYCTRELCLRNAKTCDDCRQNFKRLVALSVIAASLIGGALLMISSAN